MGKSFCFKIHLDLDPASEVVTGSPSQPFENSIAIFGLSPLAVSIFCQLLRLKEDTGLRKVVLVPMSFGEEVTKEHLEGDFNQIFSEKDIWRPVAERLKGNLIAGFM